MSGIVSKDPIRKEPVTTLDKPPNIFSDVDEFCFVLLCKNKNFNAARELQKGALGPVRLKGRKLGCKLS